MTRLRAALAGILAVAIFLPAGAGALQKKPNFSGRWVIVSPPEGAGKEQAEGAGKIQERQQAHLRLSREYNGLSLCVSPDAGWLVDQRA